MHRKFLAMTIAVAAFALPGIAQDSKLNGHWTLNISKSSFGQFPPPTSENDTITVKGNSFRQEYVSVTSRGTQNVLRSCTVDGKEVANPDETQVNLGGPMKLAKMQCSWDGKAVVFLETLNIQGGVLTDKIILYSFRRRLDDDHCRAHRVAQSADQRRSEIRVRQGRRRDVRCSGMPGAAMSATPGAAAMIHAGGGAPNLSGTWKLNLGKSNFGQIPPPPARWTRSMTANRP